MNLLKEGLENHSVRETELTRKLTIDGISIAYPVHRISLDNLFYNDKNDRIASFISQYKNEHDGKGPDLSDRDNYNQVIEKFIRDSNKEALEKTEKNIETFQQREPGVVLADGRIIDGNRRFTCLRDLSKKNPNFGYFEAVILDRDIENDAKQIKMLELTIQHGEDVKVDYDPIDKLVGVYNDVIKNKLLTDAEYSRSINVSEKEFAKTKVQANLMIEFLEFINAPEQFHLARQLNIYSSLVDLGNNLKKCPNDEMKDDMKNVVFTYFLLQKEDVTHYIRKIYKIDNINKPAYFDKVMPLVADVVEKIPSKVTSDTLSQIRTSNTENNQKMNGILEKAAQIDGRDKTKKEQIENIEDAVDALERENLDIVDRLSDEEKKEIKDLLSKLDVLINDIKEHV